MRAELPAIFITTRDIARLARLAHFHARQGNRAGELLAAELTRAVICPPEEMGRDTVTMHSRIGYRFEIGEKADERVLVYPDQFTSAGPYVSILTPLGIALLGLRVGASMPFTDFDGNGHRILVTDVVQRTNILLNEGARPRRGGKSAMRKHPEHRPLDCY